MTALNAGPLVLSRRAFGYAFLEVCLHTAEARFSALRQTLLNSVTLASARIVPSSLHQNLIYGPSLPEKSAFKTHS